jgi:hypothetical protein
MKRLAAAGLLALLTASPVAAFDPLYHSSATMEGKDGRIKQTVTEACTHVEHGYVCSNDCKDITYRGSSFDVMFIPEWKSVLASYAGAVLVHCHVILGQIQGDGPDIQAAKRLNAEIPSVPDIRLVLISDLHYSLWRDDALEHRIGLVEPGKESRLIRYGLTDRYREMRGRLKHGWGSLDHDLVDIGILSHYQRLFDDFGRYIPEFITRVNAGGIVFIEERVLPVQ